MGLLFNPFTDEKRRFPFCPEMRLSFRAFTDAKRLAAVATSFTRFKAFAFAQAPGRVFISRLAMIFADETSF